MTTEDKSAVATQLGYDEDNWDNTQNTDANKACPNGDPFIEFGQRHEDPSRKYRWWINYQWTQKSGTYAWGDGNMKSNFDPKQFWEIVGGSVTLKAFGSAQDKCITSEIVLEDILGWGRYLVTARAENGTFADLDPNSIFGLFTYQWGIANPNDPGKDNPHREMDLLETISSTAQGRPGQAQFALQTAADNDGSIHRFRYEFDGNPINPEYITAVMDWWDLGRGDRSVHFSVYNGDYSFEKLPPVPFKQWKVGQGENPALMNKVPVHTPSSKEHFHINFYLWQGKPPGRPQAVTLTRFEYRPQL